MKTSVNVHDFIDAFKKFERDNFSRLGLFALYDYLKEYEELVGEEIELDVIALCVDFTEYESLAKLNESYANEYTIDELQNETTVIEIPNSERLIVQNF